MSPDLDALRTIINVLESKTDEEIDMSAWVCGTCACAIGASAKELGMTLEYDPDDPWLIFEQYPCWQGHTGWEAVEARLQITEIDAFNLFTEEAYEEPSRIHVIARLKDYIQCQSIRT